MCCGCSRKPQGPSLLQNRIHSNMEVRWLSPCMVAILIIVSNFRQNEVDRHQGGETRSMSEIIWLCDRLSGEVSYREKPPKTHALLTFIWPPASEGNGAHVWCTSPHTFMQTIISHAQFLRVWQLFRVILFEFALKHKSLLCCVNGNVMWNHAHENTHSLFFPLCGQPGSCDTEVLRGCTLQSKPQWQWRQIHNERWYPLMIQKKRSKVEQRKGTDDPAFW